MSGNQGESVGGQGAGIPLDEHHLRKHLQLIERFPIDPKQRPLIARAIVEIALDPKRRARERIAAARALVSMDRLNVDAERGDSQPAVTVQIVNQNQAITNDPERMLDLTDDELLGIVERIERGGGEPGGGPPQPA